MDFCRENIRHRKDKYMIQWLNKMERKFGKYAIPDLTRYVVGAYCLGALLEMLTNFGIIFIITGFVWI